MCKIIFVLQFHFLKLQWITSMFTNFYLHSDIIMKVLQSLDKQCLMFIISRSHLEGHCFFYQKTPNNHLEDTDNIKY